MRGALYTHRNTELVHNFPTGKNASEQDFSLLSTDIRGGYYYYLYIDKTRSQANPTDLNQVFGLSNSSITMKDFQLKKLNIIKMQLVRLQLI